MKIIGKRVHAIPPTRQNPRSGEGDFIRLPDGRIMYAYSDYYTEGPSDHAPSRISAVFSSDEGESFGGHRVLIPPRADIVNRMCVTLMPMQNGEIGMFYGEKYLSAEGQVYMRLMLTRTGDGEHFSSPICCTPDTRYNVFENARVIRLSTGRILIPSNLHPYGEDGSLCSRGTAEFFYSDDDGMTFHRGARTECPCENLSTGLQETGVLEIEGGRVLAFSRTSGACQYISLSEDGGESFSAPLPSPYFTSPTSLLHMRHMPDGRTLAVWNPVPPTPVTKDDPKRSGCWARTPLACAVADGMGEKFLGDVFGVPAKVFILEDDPTECFCYPAVFFGKDYFLCAYYHSYGSGFPLSASVIKKIDLSELEEA
ncbi:MAG: exo-alpha-sialidase [Clostridia bacterium]|nr:exo-alpha-sialidase [Clostridia bacterium]